MRVAFSSILVASIIAAIAHPVAGLRRAELDPDVYAVAARTAESPLEVATKICKRLGKIDVKADELEARTELLSEPDKARLSGLWTTFAIARAEASQALVGLRRLPEERLIAWIDDENWHCELLESTLTQIENNWQ
jgi:hypothetical protein